MSADRPCSILSGLILSVESTPVAMRTQSSSASTESNISGHASWKSLLYVEGVPLAMASMPARLPWARPALPRRSSRASGFFFWGMREEPVA